MGFFFTTVPPGVSDVFSDPAEPPAGSQQHRQPAQEPGCDPAGHRDQEAARSAAER